MLLCACVCLGILALIFAYGHYSWGVFEGYFSSATILILNVLPVVLLIFLLYAACGRAWLAFLLGGLVTLGLSIGNYYKLQFRDDPLCFEDFLVLREAKTITTQSKYTLFVDKRIVVAVLCLALGTVLLFFLVRGVARGWKRRVPVLAVTVLAAAVLWPVYESNDIYKSVENYDYLNRWGDTQNYIAHGFLYPFLHGASQLKDTPPEGYNEADVQALLDGYADADIPADQRVSIISYMREAYIDFSQFDIPGLDSSGYDLYHQL